MAMKHHQENFSKDIFAVQLEVTGRLLEVERRKLKQLRRESIRSGGSISSNYVLSKSVEKQQSALRRLGNQHDQLVKEYNHAVMGVIRRSSISGTSSRSLPALGLKQAVKSRPSLFNSLNGNGSSPRDDKTDGNGNEESLAALFIARDPGTLLRNGNVEGIELHKELNYKNGHLVSGTADALIRKLIPSECYYPERTFLFSFLLCSRLYILPSKLLDRVTQTVLANIKANPAQELAIAKGMVQLLTEWTDFFPYDYRDEKMMKLLRDVTQYAATLHPDLRKAVGMLTQPLMQKLSSLEKYEKVLSRVDDMLAISTKRDIVQFPDGIFTVVKSPLELARQLTLVEVERLINIGPEEFVQTFVSDKNSSKDCSGEVKRTSNLEVYVEWFNRLSYLVATEVCMASGRKERGDVIDFFIETARQCLALGNFNSMMSIIEMRLEQAIKAFIKGKDIFFSANTAGLNMNCITRLKKTWSKVKTARYELLEHQMNPESNFGTYRSSLKEAMADSKRRDHVIPFFTLLVKDIYFLNEGVINKLPSGHINFEKFWQLAKQITEIISWKQVKCNFDRRRAILAYLVRTPIFSEDELYKASYECEAPETEFEKDKYSLVREKITSTIKCYPTL